MTADNGVEKRFGMQNPGALLTQAAPPIKRRTEVLLVNRDLTREERRSNIINKLLFRKRRTASLPGNRSLEYTDPTTIEHDSWTSPNGKAKTQP